MLTGMMVRKSQEISEERQDELEIVNFISEYKTRCQQDIDHLPVVEKTKKDVTLKGFAACRQLFDTYKRERGVPFFYWLSLYWPVYFSMMPWNSFIRFLSWFSLFSTASGAVGERLEGLARELEQLEYGKLSREFHEIAQRGNSFIRFLSWFSLFSTASRNHFSTRPFSSRQSANRSDRPDSFRLTFLMMVSHSL